MRIRKAKKEKIVLKPKLSRLSETSSSPASGRLADLCPETLTLEQEKPMLETRKEREAFLKESCERSLEAEAQIKEARAEYQAVTAYLMDIQKIERAPEEDRELLLDAARRILILTRERAAYRDRTIKITDRQFDNVQKYEGDAVKAIRQMKENESRRLAIEGDIRQLEQEKKKLSREKKEIVEKQGYLKKLSIITSVLVLLLFVMLLGIAYAFETDMVIPYIMTIILAAASAFYIFMEAGKNRRGMLLTERKLNRAILLLNKVKIKYINNTSALDYACEKYGVNSATEFEYLWEEYLKAREAAKRYRKNTELLNQANEQLVAQMKKLETADPEIWIYQAAALLDNREMVEIRHRLNARRQNLRERIEYNTALRDEAGNRIRGLVQSRPEARREAVGILKAYHMELWKEFEGEEETQ